jgi:hypothetical protein
MSPLPRKLACYCVRRAWAIMHRQRHTDQQSVIEIVNAAWGKVHAHSFETVNAAWRTEYAHDIALIFV